MTPASRAIPTGLLLYAVTDSLGDAMRDVDRIRELTIRSLRAENQQILVSFSDTGVGIPPQIAEQIFHPFLTAKAHGTGMGLRICRSIIESHGGRLWPARLPRARRNVSL